VHGKQLVISVCQDQIACRGQQLQPDHQGKEAAYEKEKGDRNEVQQRNALMVRSEQP
jgi:hypothetical protein